MFGDDRERQRRHPAGILAEDKATLSVGNRVLGAMLSSGLSRVAFTTNFDSIVQKGSNSQYAVTWPPHIVIAGPPGRAVGPPEDKL